MVLVSFPDPSVKGGSGNETKVVLHTVAIVHILQVFRSRIMGRVNKAINIHEVGHIIQSWGVCVCVCGGGILYSPGCLVAVEI